MNQSGLNKLWHNNNMNYSKMRCYLAAKARYHRQNQCQSKPKEENLQKIQHKKYSSLSAKSLLPLPPSPPLRPCCCIFSNGLSIFKINRIRRKSLSKLHYIFNAFHFMQMFAFVHRLTKSVVHNFAQVMQKSLYTYFITIFSHKVVLRLWMSLVGIPDACWDRSTNPYKYM